MRTALAHQWRKHSRLILTLNAVALGLVALVYQRAYADLVSAVDDARASGLPQSAWRQFYAEPSLASAPELAFDTGAGLLVGIGSWAVLVPLAAALAVREFRWGTMAAAVGLAGRSRQLLLTSAAAILGLASVCATTLIGCRIGAEVARRLAVRATGVEPTGVQVVHNAGPAAVIGTLVLVSLVNCLISLCCGLLTRNTTTGVLLAVAVGWLPNLVLEQLPGGWRVPVLPSVAQARLVVDVLTFPPVGVIAPPPAPVQLPVGVSVALLLLFAAVAWLLLRRAFAVMELR